MVEHLVANEMVAGSRPVSRFKKLSPERSTYEDNGFLEQKSDCNGFEID